MFSAINVARASSIPSVQPATCGVIKTLGEFMKGKDRRSGLTRRRRISVPNVERGAANALFAQSEIKRLLVNQCRPRDVDQYGGLLHQRQLRCTDQSFG